MKLSKYDYIIVGAGGFGREVLSWLLDSHTSANIKGFISDDLNILDNYGTPYDIISTIDSYEIQENDRFILAIGEIEPKKKVVKILKQKGAKFISFIHSTAVIANTSKMGEGCVIGPMSFVSDHVVLNDFVMFGFYASCGHDTIVGKYSILSPYATVNGFTELEDEVFMGTHSSVAARRRIGSGSKISSGTAVMYDVPSNSFVMGVPGKSRIIFKEGENADNNK